MMLSRAFLRLPRLGERAAGGGAAWGSPRSSISMVMMTLGGGGPPAPASAPGGPSLPANRYFLSLRESPGPPLAFLAPRPWSSMA